MPDSRAHLPDIDFDQITEQQAVQHILAAIRRHRGGWVATPNIDICRHAHRDPALRRLVKNASLIVPDGMPLVWAARLRGYPVPERVAGGSLIFSLTEAATHDGLSIYLLGGATEVPYRAAAELCRRYPGLMVAGADAPPSGFDADPQAVELIRGQAGRRRARYRLRGPWFPQAGTADRRARPVVPGDLVHRLRGGHPLCCRNPAQGAPVDAADRPGLAVPVAPRATAAVPPVPDR